MYLHLSVWCLGFGVWCSVEIMFRYLVLNSKFQIRPLEKHQNCQGNFQRSCHEPGALTRHDTHGRKPERFVKIFRVYVSIGKSLRHIVEADMLVCHVQTGIPVLPDVKEILRTKIVDRYRPEIHHYFSLSGMSQFVQMS